MKKYENKKNNVNKCYNIIKKIKGCLECHKIIKNKIKKITIKNIKKNYKNIIKYKIKLKYNINMSKIVKNLKNKYILEICKYLKNLPKFKKFLKIN